MRKIIFLMMILVFLFGCVFMNKPKEVEKSNIKPVQYQPTLEDQLDELTAQIILSLSQEKKSKIAIIEFPDLQGNITQFGRFLAEELITRLYLTGKFEVIERQLLNQVMQEHRLMLEGIIDENSAKELGRILGVDAICSGSVADLVSSVKVNARMISAETGKIFSVASVEILKNEVIRKMLNESSTTEVSTGSAKIEADNDTGSSFAVLSEYKSNDVLFQLNNCRIEDRKVICDLTVFNQSENDKNLIIWLLHTVFYDQVGNDYHVTRVQLANTETKPNMTGSWGGGSRLEKKIISGIPTPLHIEFGTVSSQVEFISLLEINCGDFVVEFRDIDL